MLPFQSNIKAQQLEALNKIKEDGQAHRTNPKILVDLAIQIIQATLDIEIERYLEKKNIKRIERLNDLNLFYIVK